METIEDLATALISNDYDKKCKLNCDKDGWGKDGHAESCPFAIAYRLTPEAPPPLPASPDSAPPGRLWHIQEGFTLELSGEFLELVYGDDEAVRFHIDEIDDLLSALKLAQSHIKAEEIKKDEAKALARWGRERIPTE